MGGVAPLDKATPESKELVLMVSPRWRRPRRGAVALVFVFLAVFLTVPSSTATAMHRHGHGRHIEHFLVMSTDPSQSATPVVIATGPLHARGTDIVVDGTRDHFKFPRGTLFVRHHVHKKSVRDSFDKVTCYFKHTERGSYRITGGTGAYADAFGHGRYSVRASGVGCDQNAAPEDFFFEIKARGPLHP